MKKNILLFVIVLMSVGVSKIYACDVCGSGTGTNYIGILPEFKKNILGFRYRYNTMWTHLNAGDGTKNYLSNHEFYHTAELWGAYTFKENYRMMVNIPFAYNIKENQGFYSYQKGLGDITTLFYYQLINKRKTVLKNKLLAHSLWIGGGIKFPTGKYESNNLNNYSNNTNAFQLGTGSYDFMLNAMYDIRMQDVGINLNTNYKINMTNAYEYYYGNKWNSTMQVYYKWNLKNIFTISPNLGLQYEMAEKDFNKGFDVFATGGNNFLGGLGIEFNYNSVALGVNFQTPIYQAIAHKMVQAEPRFMMHLAYSF